MQVIHIIIYVSKCTETGLESKIYSNICLMFFEAFCLHGKIKHVVVLYLFLPNTFVR